ncbi:MAG TPA: phosphotransferase, partial [Polyangiaceae bacterium]
MAILERLAALRLSFRVPRVVRCAAGSGRAATIRTFLPGIELDLRAGRQTSVKPWLVVGELAAAVHQLPAKVPRDCLPNFTSREGFASYQVESLRRGRHHPDVARAIAWAKDSKPVAGPASVIHGDLLGQNILLAPGERPALIDWERCALGDPAYDLAVVTRGVRRPFQIDRGLD